MQDILRREADRDRKIQEGEDESYPLDEHPVRRMNRLIRNNFASSVKYTKK
jgi:hypothetical protein